MTQQYPHEFLGRCSTCLDNAYLSNDPCRPMMGVNGAPLFANGCPIYRARKEYDKERAMQGNKTNEQ